jgi:hypothetical protein
MKTKKLKITGEDLIDYNLWIKGKMTSNPRLLEKIRDESFYKLCMEEFEDNYYEKDEE